MRKKIDPLAFEEEFLHESKREHKKQKKQRSQIDRSQFTLKERKQVPLKTVSTQKNIGRIISIRKEGATVFFEDKTFICNLRGSLKKDPTLLKNLIAVGDRVVFDPEQNTIESIENRTSYLSRMDLVRKKEDILVVNVDIVFIVQSVILPPLKPFLIDRFLIAARKGNISPIVIFNKIDLLENAPEEKKLVYELCQALEKSSIPTLMVSVIKNIGLDTLRSFMENKTSVFAGQSGVGKSSLINAVTGSTLKTGPVVAKTFKGAHVTTEATLIPLNHESFCVDTPGIKSFGIWQLTQQEIIDHFIEFSKFSPFCRYKGCLHLKEPGCAVKEAVAKREIHPLRFESYQCLMEEITKEIQHR